MGGIAGVGFAFRLIAQQATKFLNLVWPASGAFVSSVVVATGTNAIGKAAIAYYIEGNNLEQAKEQFKMAQK